MEMLEVIYGRSYLPISVAIQIRTWCWWSHVGVILPDGSGVLEARGGVGVVVTPMDEFKARYRETMTGYIACKSVDEALAYGYSRIGLKYDDTAFWGIGLGLDIHDLDADQCAELVADMTGIYPKHKTSFWVPKDLVRMTHATK